MLTTSKDGGKFRFYSFRGLLELTMMTGPSPFRARPPIIRLRLALAFTAEKLTWDDGRPTRQRYNTWMSTDSETKWATCHGRSGIYMVRDS